MSKGTPIRLGLLALTAAALTLATAGTTLAGSSIHPQWQGKSTSNPTGTTNWFTSSNWDTGAPPASTDQYDGINANGSIVDIDRAGAVANKLYLADTNATVILNINDTTNNGTSLAVTNGLFIGRRGTTNNATINQIAGTVTVSGGIEDSSYVNGSNTPTGTYNLQGGSLNVTGDTSLGYSSHGTGYFTQSGGTFVGQSFSVSVGTLKLDGSGGISFTVSQLNIGVNSTLAFVLDDSGVTPITSKGQVTLKGILDVSLDGYTGSGPITLIDYHNGGLLNPDANTFSTIDLHGFTADIDYTTDDQVRLTNIVVSPEPASAALLLLGAGGLLMIRRKGIEA